MVYFILKINSVICFVFCTRFPVSHDLLCAELHLSQNIPLRILSKGSCNKLSRLHRNIDLQTGNTDNTNKVVSPAANNDFLLKCQLLTIKSSQTDQWLNLEMFSFTASSSLVPSKHQPMLEHVTLVTLENSSHCCVTDFICSDTVRQIRFIH